MPERNNGKPAPSGPVQDQIQENLRRLYDETLNEDLPAELLELIQKLKDGDAQK